MPKPNALPRSKKSPAHTPGPEELFRYNFSSRCGCRLVSLPEGLKIAYCSTHSAAPDLLAALVSLRKELWAAGLNLNVKKHFSLMAAEAQAGTAILKAEGGKTK